jgi:hypothetical protein
LWKCGDGLFFKVLPLASDALLTTLHPLLENVLQTVDDFGISCLGAPFSWLEKPRNRMGRDLDCMTDVLMGFHHPVFYKLRTVLKVPETLSQGVKRPELESSHSPPSH